MRVLVSKLPLLLMLLVPLRCVSSSTAKASARPPAAMRCRVSSDERALVKIKSSLARRRLGSSPDPRRHEREVSGQTTVVVAVMFDVSHRKLTFA